MVAVVHCEVCAAQVEVAPGNSATTLLDRHYMVAHDLFVIAEAIELRVAHCAICLRGFSSISSAANCACRGGPPALAVQAVQAALPAGGPPVCVCAICRAAAPTHVIVPCGHVCVCEECRLNPAFHLVSRCPICRGPLGQVMKLYFNEV